uniref:Uncharacterized protein n=1 Tax=Eptatretus burgeri TaxID=7764 RepID=A0A8C4Q7I4_EPTBU
MSEEREMYDEDHRLVLGRESSRVRDIGQPMVQDSEAPKVRESEPSKVEESEPSKVEESEPSKVEESEPCKMREIEPPGVREIEPPGVREIEPPGVREIEPPGVRESDAGLEAVLMQRRRLHQATRFVHKDSVNLLPLAVLRRLGSSKDTQPHSVFQRRVLHRQTQVEASTSTTTPTTVQRGAAALDTSAAETSPGIQSEENTKKTPGSVSAAEDS